MRLTHSLKDALTWRFISVAVLPLLVVGLVSFDIFSRETEQRLENEHLFLAESIAAQVALELRDPYLLIREIPHLIDPSALEPSVANLLLNKLVRENHGFESVLLFNANDQFVAGGFRQPALDEAQQLQYARSRKTALDGNSPLDKAVWSEPFIAQGEDGISLAVALRSERYSLIGTLDLVHLRQLLKKLIGSKGDHLLLLDAQGRAVVQMVSAPDAALSDLEPLLRDISTLSADSRTINYALAGKRYLGATARLPKMAWSILYGQNDATLTAAIWRLRYIFLLGCLVASFFAALLSRTLARKIVRPLGELITGARSFAAGDYQHSLPFGNHREIDELSESFRRMRVAIDEREQQLWKNQEYFQRLFNGVTDAIFIATRLPNGKPGNYLEVNNVACKMLGYGRDELLQMSPYGADLICADEADGFQFILGQISSDGKSLYKSRLRCKDGTLLPVEVGCQLFELSGKRVYFFVARDITLREKYESAIKTLVRSTVGLTGQDCLDEITTNLCNWMGADGASVGLFQGGNLMVQSSCIDQRQGGGYSMPIAGTPYPEIRDGAFMFLAENVCSGYPEMQGAGLPEIDSFIGIPMLGREGQVIGAISVCSREPLRAVPHAEELLSVIASRASSECERMHYERELSRSEEMLRTLFSSTAEAIVGINLQGDCIFCNPASLRILGYSDESELIGQRFHQLARYVAEGEPEVLHADCPFIATIQRDETIIAAAARFTHSAGHPVPVELWGHPLSEGGEVVGGVVTFIDISQRRILEEQLQQSQRLEAIGTLTGGIAHDFNNILTVITGYAGLMQAEYKDDARLLSKVNKVAEAAERGSKLTHGLLAYSRKKAGPSTPVDLNQVVIKVRDLFGKVIGERIEKRIDLADQQLVVLADTSQLEQLLVNLATNARDAMPDGGVLHIRTSRQTIDRNFCSGHGYGEPGEYALITVEDNGSGISKDVQQKIFDPFYTTKDTGKGTGLGLAIAWGVVKQHKGYILVDSEPGAGTRFRIYLPLSQQAVVPQLLANNDRLPGGDETILLVEDDPQVRDSTCSILTAVGYQVISSDCADSALQVLAQQESEISLILSDVVMPGMKGTEFYQEIRKLTSVPVIFISGYTFDALREQGLVGDDFILLNKPIQPIDLLTRIRETIDREQATIGS